jgi:hypothetical protein
VRRCHHQFVDDVRTALGGKRPAHGSPC